VRAFSVSRSMGLDSMKPRRIIGIKVRSVTLSSGNIFRDIGFPPFIARRLQQKSQDEIARMKAPKADSGAAPSPAVTKHTAFRRP